MVSHNPALVRSLSGPTVSFTPQALECTTLTWSVLIYGTTPVFAYIATQGLLGLLKRGNFQYFTTDGAFTTFAIIHFVVFTTSLTVLTASII